MIQLDNATSFTSAFSVLTFIETLDAFYTDVSYWYVNRVIPGLFMGDDRLIIARDNQRIAGVALGKRGDESKLRCIRVHPDYQNSGLGVRLIDAMLDQLEDSKPGVTVAEELFHRYSRMFITRYGFALTAVTKGRYRPRKLEYGYNGA